MMAAPAFDAARFIRPALLSNAIYFLALLFLSVTIARNSHAAGNIAQPQSWCVNTVGVFYGCTFTSAVNACAGANAYPSASSATTGYCLQNGTGQSLGLAYYFYSYKPCPTYSAGAGGTCTCNDSYMPDPAGTSCVLANACPTNMSGTPCACNAGYVPSPYGTGCIEEQYTLSVLQDSFPDVEPGSSRDVIVRVTSMLTGNPKNGARVSLKADVDVTSGGHAHGGADRDKGALNGAACDPPEKYCATATTDSDGYVSFTYKAPAVSGKHTVAAACVSPDCSNTDTGNINVKVDGLVPIPSAPTLYAFVGGEEGKKHHDNHYLTDNALGQLVVLAINYHFLFPNEPVLHLNDASLVWGGKFDINGNWGGDHQAHKRGTVIDIRANQINEKTSTNFGSSIPESLFNDFEKLAAKTKIILAGRVISVQARLHCSIGFDQANNCAGDENRHYHVILLGVDQ